eukprot:TRINITY_DN36_c0_g1_i2.p1 TRINITY_DN36_c0_g1~~TRINITY_DN36_c0_g1_i2.p1  ORF type:complete len:492 (+),score=132.27 TRINITY_DN36_c0_g1_i2:121-1476(+)
MDRRPENVGILAVEVYFPSTYIKQEELESFDGVSSGKYTIGLGQLEMAFVDRLEDVVSISMTSVKNLLEKYNIDPKDIGRLEVGTETIIDKSKAVKTHLMELFTEHGNYSIEGVDCTNACYGGTAALFNSVAWVESRAWDGRYALAVASDVAVYSKGNARPTGGCGSVAMLIGPNAPLVLESDVRTSYMDHVWDFYKPELASEYPTVDGHHSVLCYYKAIDYCYAGVRQQLKKKDVSLSLDTLEYACMHSPFNKLVAKSVGRLLFNEFAENPDDSRFEAVQKFRGISLEESIGNKEIEGAFTKLAAKYYDEKVVPSVMLPKRLGNTYTASVYTGLASLLFNKGTELLGKRIFIFSYGSGLCSSLFGIKVREDEVAREGLLKIQSILDLENRLSARIAISPAAFSAVMEENEETYGANDFDVDLPIDLLQPGTYYLTKVDDRFRRFYARKSL